MKFERFDFEAAFGTGVQLPPSTVAEVAFAGRSNVGKSSLLNKILNRKSLARVSSMPGKTVTINFYSGDGIRLVDLPGYGYAKVSHSEKKRWSELMEEYFSSGRKIRLVVQLTDMRHELTNDDHTMLLFLKEMGFPFIVVMTKSDKLNKTERAQRLEQLKVELKSYGSVEAIPFSAVTGEGAEKIREQIEKYTESE
ncbi:MAG: YihA family ribosome biogenesis GTP-binding protein [Clostridiales bacterium]|jgi:GTP-binding protein|nr:YihA family ribosome biogenesis GTP-binding protein [Clostridiales bacterium]